jgi:hypothetical protein
MARVKRQDNSRIEHICSKGGHVIPKGDSYLMASPGYRRRKPIIRCLAHPFRPSELTTSARSEPLSAMEAFEDAANEGFATIEELQSAWDDLGQALEDYLSQRDEALEAWEHGNSQLEEYRDQAQEAYDTWEGHTIEEWSGDDEPQREDFKDTDKGQRKFDEAWEEWESEHSEHVSSQTAEAQEVAGSLDV